MFRKNMKTETAFIVAQAICLAMGAYAAEYTYTSGDASLADGKITFAYDGSGKITELSMKPDYGETLTLTGDTLAFAEGADVFLGHRGTNEIACLISSDGAVNLSPADGPYTWTTSTRGLNAKSFATLFENCNLDMIEPVSATPVSFMTGSGDTAYPYFITRGVDADGTKWMKFEIQCGEKGYLRALYIQLKQNGNNVTGKIIDGAYLNSSGSSKYIGHSLLLEPETSLPGYTHYTRYYADDNTETGGFGISTLTIKTRGQVTFPVNGTLNLATALAGSNVDVTFKAASATATVNANAACSLVDSAYIITGDAEHMMKFYATHYDSTAKTRTLPQDGTTDVYGANTELHLNCGNSGLVGGSAAGNSTITMHTGTKLYAENKSYAFRMQDQSVVLDGASLTMNKGSYLRWLTMNNGATVDGSAGLSFGYDGESATWHIGGVGASTFGRNLSVSGGRSKQHRELTLDVADTVVGDGADFVMNGNLTYSSAFPGGSFAKTGEGTMLMNGTLTTLDPYAARIVEGTLLIGKSDGLATGAKFSLEGGTLGFADGTVNTVADVTLTKSSKISVGEGATLTIAGLTVPEDSTLSINGDVLGNVKVSTSLDSDTLSRIRINGKAAYQAGSGYFVKRGLIISVQ